MHNAEKLYPSKMRRLACFEEAAGILHEIMEQDDSLIVLIGQNRFTISLDLGQSLRPLIGQRITILRTDIQDKPYLFRVLA